MSLPEIRFSIEPHQIPFQAPEPHVLRNMNRILHKKAPLFAGISALLLSFFAMVFAPTLAALFSSVPTPLLISLLILPVAASVWILTYELYFKTKVTGIITGKVTEYYDKNNPETDLTGAQMITVLFDEPAGTA